MFYSGNKNDICKSETGEEIVKMWRGFPSIREKSLKSEWGALILGLKENGEDRIKNLKVIEEMRAKMQIPGSWNMRATPEACSPMLPMPIYYP